MEIADIKSRGIVDERCKACFHKAYTRLLDKFNVVLDVRQKYWTLFEETINSTKAVSSPLIQRELFHKFCSLTKIADPFQEEKTDNNKVALDLYAEWKQKVAKASNPYDLSLRLAIAGNIMDFGANDQFDIHQTITRVLNSQLAINHSTQLYQRIQEASKIIYLGDNAGEIVFDRLFLETLDHKNVTFVVKGGPIINDVTMSDAKESGIDQVAKIISNGFDAPSTVLSKSSPEFIETYRTADLIISKGQGNFEGLLQENDARIFFILMAKCDVIAEILKVKKGSFIVYNQELSN